VNEALALALDRMGCNVSINPWQATISPEYPLTERLHALSYKPPYGGLTIRHTYPHCPEGIQGRQKALILPWEVSLLPSEWLDPLNRLDFIFTPSQFSRKALIKSGVEQSKVRVIANGVDLERFHPHVPPLGITGNLQQCHYTRPDLSLTRRTFKFLHLGHAQIRKGTDLLIDAYLQEFTGKDDVCLVVKSYDEGDILPWITASVKGSGDAPRLLYIYGNTPPHLLPSYYTACDCVVHPCRGEGFGLPLLEAQACALPVIVTGWSGPMDFCTKENSYLLNYELESARDFHVPVPKEAVWAKPDIEHLRYLMRYVYEHSDEAQQKGQVAAQQAAWWSWDRAAYELVKIILSS